MNKAKGVFLTLLRSPSQEVRRAAAEGLGFLSTLGVREDARFLQSAILHDLDEVIQGTQDHEQGKALSLESIAAGRSAAVLALACMQRTACRIKEQRDARARERGGSIDRHDESNEDVLPLFQILIKILPSITIRTTGGFLGVRAVGLHAFGLLFFYSKKIQAETLSPQESHLLKKIIELIEDNFISAWTAASVDFDHGTDEEKLSIEVSFVAVLLRLMTFLTPSLSRLEGIDQQVAMRFSRLAMLATESLGAHPIVKIEAMAFYEVMSQHQYLLPPHADGVKYEEHAILSCIPMVMESISPRRITIQPNHDARLTACGMSSQNTLRAALKVIHILCRSNILVAEWSGMKMVALLFAALEDLLGKQTYTGNTLHRGLAAPRESESLYQVPDITAKELSQVMCLLVLQERSQSQMCLSFLLRYILLSRCVVLGSSAASSDDEDEDKTQPMSASRVVQSALKRANSDGAPLLEYANPARWQVKIMAVQVMTIALHEMKKQTLSGGGELATSHDFNPKEAKRKCEKACHEATAQGTGPPESILSLHIGSLVGAACGMATATVDQAELRCLQESAMYLIRQLIECFGNIPDPDQPDTTVLHDDIPQISSAIKTALGAPVEEYGATSCRLFFAGCQTLHAFLKMKVTNDRAVLKRFFRPVIPDSDEVVLFGIDQKLPTNLTNGSRKEEHVNTRANLLVHIGKLWILGNIPKDDVDLLELVSVDKTTLGAHAGSLAIDGARLLLNEGLTLCGTELEIEIGTPTVFDPLYLEDWQAIDNSVKAALSSTWASLAATAVTFLTQSMKLSEEHEKAESWLQRIVPFLFAGWGDAIIARNMAAHSQRQPKHEWARCVDPTKVASCCLEGISALSSYEEIHVLNNSWKAKIERVFSDISSNIFEPILLGKSNAATVESEIDLIKICCAFISNVCKRSPSTVTESASMLLAILRPLSLLENGEVDLSAVQPSSIISACLTAVSMVLDEATAPPSLVQAMVAVSLKLSAGEKPLLPSLKTAIRILMKACLLHESITMKDQSDVAFVVASSKDWETWGMVVQAKDGAAAEASLNYVQQCLLECINDAQQLPLLTVLRTLLQSSPPPSASTGRFVCSILAEILLVFRSYATLQVPTNLQSHRTAVCAESMKIALVAVQQLSLDGTAEEDVAQFLLLLFQTWIASIRYNGLPNHPPPHIGSSDAALGRMCAQAITHVARTAAVPFKLSMGLMFEQDRGVLEFAVRAEMNGYAVAPAQAAPKKKLNLQSFKK